MNRLCTICLRAGSKGVKNKNIRLMNGQPLFTHSLDQALKLALFTAIAISTDSEEILDIVRSRYPSVLCIVRPPELASDSAPKLPAIRHCVKSVEELLSINFDTIVDLDATSPLRTLDDIRAAINLLETAHPPNVITGCKSRKSPYFNLVEREDDGSVKLSKKLPEQIMRRQDTPQSFDMNASIYVWQKDILMKYDTLFKPGTLLFEMPEDRSFDIDTELDFEIVEMIMKRRGAERDL